MQTFTAPVTGNYKLEVWGGQGHYSEMKYAGKGGYAKGTAYILKNTAISVCVGGQGKRTKVDNTFSPNTGGYNGGGDGQYGGGGATHMAITDRGELYNYEDYQSEVLLVAGGGGAGDSWAYGGSGGGLSGDAGTGNPGYGGTQSIGGAGYQSGSFGRGGNAPDQEDSCGGGGGGWYGGGSGFGGYGCGGGGSGYIGGVTNSSMQNGVREGNGYAIISWQ